MANSRDFSHVEVLKIWSIRARPKSVSEVAAAVKRSKRKSYKALVPNED